MKAKLYAVAVAALMSAACFTSCTNDEVLPEQAQTAVSTCPDVIYVNFDQATRVVMGEGNKPMWGEYDEEDDEYDVVYVLSKDANGNRIYSRYYCTNPSIGQFTRDERGWLDWDSEEETSAVPVGPYIISSTPSNYEFAPNSVLITQNDWYHDPDVLSDAHMLAQTNDLNETVTLKNVMALLKVTIKEGSKLTYVGVEASFKESGRYVLGSENPWTDLVDAEESTVVMIGWPWYYPENDETIDNVGELPSGDYYIPIIPQTLSGNDGPSLRLYWSDAKEAYNWDEEPSIPSTYRIQEKRSSFTLEAGKIYDLGVLD